MSTLFRGWVAKQPLFPSIEFVSNYWFCSYFISRFISFCDRLQNTEIEAMIFLCLWDITSSSRKIMRISSSMAWDFFVHLLTVIVIFLEDLIHKFWGIFFFKLYFSLKIFFIKFVMLSASGKTGLNNIRVLFVLNSLWI